MVSAHRACRPSPLRRAAHAASNAPPLARRPTAQRRPLGPWRPLGHACPCGSRTRCAIGVKSASPVAPSSPLRLRVPAVFRHDIGHSRGYDARRAAFGARKLWKAFIVVAGSRRESPRRSLSRDHRGIGFRCLSESTGVGVATELEVSIGPSPRHSRPWEASWREVLWETEGSVGCDSKSQIFLPEWLGVRAHHTVDVEVSEEESSVFR
jgi:hypothetical protein